MKIFLILTTMIILNSCGTTSSYYILSNVQNTAVLKYINLSIGVEKVEVPKYLFKKELAILSSNNQVKFRSDVQWAEDMDEALTRRIIGSLQKKCQNPNISSYPWGITKQPSIVLHINITKFIAHNGKVHLDATYRITKTKTAYTKAYIFNTQVTISDTQSSSIVSSMDSAIEKLINDIVMHI
jgi:cholesterol transport system auxiliary component